jgi:hypothetical protein
LAVDLNADHLAGWVLNAAGNPLGLPVSITLALQGLPAPTRDGRLRAAVAEMVHLAVRQRCRALVVEHLDFDDARQVARETLGRGRRGKRFRRVGAGMPTRRFRELLAGMAANAADSAGQPTTPNAASAAMVVVSGPAAQGPGGRQGQRAGPPTAARKTRLPDPGEAGNQAAQDRPGPPVSAVRDTRADASGTVRSARAWRWLAHVHS